MALELQIGTAKAQANLAAIEKSVKSLEARMKGFKGGNVNAAIAGIKPIPGTVAASVGKVGAATDKASASAKRATGSFKGLKGALGGVRSTAGLLAASLSAVGITSFVKEAWQMNNVTDRAKAVFTDLSGSAKGAGSRLEFVKKTAAATATPIKTAINSYTTLSQSAVKMGISQEDVDKTFTDVAIAFRSIGSTSDQAKRGMTAVTQVFSKGKAGAEELRQQMGEIVPIIPAIARALDRTPAQIEKAMSSGTLSVEDFRKGIGLLAKEAGPVLEIMMGKAAAKATLLSNAVTILAGKFGNALFTALIPVMETLTGVFQGMAGEVGKTATTAQQVGQALAAVGGYIASAMPLIIALAAAFAAYGATLAVAGIINWGIAVVSTVTQAVGVMGGLVASGVRVAAAMVGIGTASTGAAAGTTLLATATRILGAAFAFAKAAFLPLLAAVAAAGAIYAAYMVVTGQSAELSKQLGEAIIWIGEQLGFTRAEVVGGIQALGKWVSAVSKSNAITRTAGAVYDYVKQKLAEAREIILSTGVAMGEKLTSAFKIAASVVRGVSDTIVGAVSGIISVVNRAISALRSLAGMQTGGGGGSGSGPGAAQGGIIGANGGFSGPQVSLAGHNFKGAPRFANGGTTGSTGVGGIPAILHPNEAVIPLQNGSVPVSLSGGDAVASGGTTVNNNVTTAAGGGSGSGARDMGRALRTTNQLMSRMVDRMQTLINLSSDQFRMINLRLTNIEDVVRQINTSTQFIAAIDWDALTAPPVSVSSGSFGSSSFSSSSGSSGSGSDANMQNQFIAGAINKSGIGSAPPIQYRMTLPIGPAGGGAGAVGLKVNPNYAKEKAQYDQDFAEYQDWVARTGAGTRGFAGGTPNTSREGLTPADGGGMLARVHNNEAIIPLPDGRSVPVVMKNVADMGGSSGNSTTQVVVHMTVNAKDATSFKRNENQMIQDMTVKMERAAKTIGVPQSPDLTAKKARG